MNVLESSNIGPRRRPSAPLAPAAVLVIDDDAAVCHTLASLLGRRTYGGQRAKR